MDNFQVVNIFSEMVNNTNKQKSAVNQSTQVQIHSQVNIHQLNITLQFSFGTLSSSYYDKTWLILKNRSQQSILINQLQWYQ